MLLVVKPSFCRCLNLLRISQNGPLVIRGAIVLILPLCILLAVVIQSGNIHTKQMDEHNEENLGDFSFLERLLKSDIVKDSVNDASARFEFPRMVLLLFVVL
jgi:transcriptional regulator of heat shock response